MNLYEIKAEYVAAIESLFDSVDEETGEVNAGTVERINELKAAMSEKLDAVGAYIKNLKSDVDALDNEIKALTARKKAKENKIESLKNYALPFVEEMDDKKFESSRVAFSVRSSEKTIVTDESVIPAEFFKVKTERSPDLTAIKAAIKAGKITKGAEIQKKNNLQIK